MFTSVLKHIKQKTILNNQKIIFDVVILDQKIPIMKGLQDAVKILNINP